MWKKLSAAVGRNCTWS